jgi:hypothetical protein
MKMLFQTAAAAALLAASATFAQAEPIVSEIEVTSDFASVENTMAAEYWPSIEADLKAELSTRLAPYAGEDGMQIRVSIRDLALNAAASDMSYRDLNTIDGTVAIRGPEEDSQTKSYRVAFSVVPPEGMEPMEGVIVLPPDTADNYAALIDAVVDEVEKGVMDYSM